jgi:hypothetical protein
MTLFLLHLAIQPFKDKTENGLEMVSLLVLWIISTVLTGVTAPLSYVNATALAILVLITSFYLFGYVFYTLLPPDWRTKVECGKRFG